MRWLTRCSLVDAGGLEIQRSFPQISRGIGPELGWKRLPAVQAHDRYRNLIARQLDRLVEMGFLNTWRPVYAANGEGVGIVVHLRADVAQLAGGTSSGHGARRRRAQPVRRAAGPTLSPPVEAGTTYQPSTSGAREARAGRDPAAALASCRAALEAVNDLDEWAGVEIVAAVPDLAVADPLALARAAAPRLDPRVSQAARQRFDAACRRLSRCGYCGLTGSAAAAAAVLDAADSDAWREFFAKPTRSLGGVANILRATANKERRRARAAARRAGRG